ncbi:MAG: hypothetical protein M3460_21570 [Actinomycetota bacterium]|nr:hypothetical protein [Actinomycetota bacterium]
MAELTNGHGGPRAGAAVAAARPVILVRYRPGVTGEIPRIVHVVPLPTNEQAGAVGALCGAVLKLDGIETVRLGEGMPCTVCVVNLVTGSTLAEEPLATGGLVGAAAYQKWG